MNTEPADRVRTLRRDRVSWRVVDDQAVLLDLATSEYLSLNRTGTILWCRLERGATSTELADALAAAVARPPESVAGDVAEFVTMCEERAFLG